MFDILFGWRKASKCKKLIKRVQCRLKLLKNKRCAIVRQLRKDIAELIKIGCLESAFNRVEQLFKDESIMEVYELLDHYCEFIIAHLSYIRRNKDCPNDINEAVSTLIFASARCGDLPELPGIRKLFGERYGQRFANAAVELLPGNLVNHQIKEKLSIKSVPDDVKHRLMDEITRNYCFQPEFLAIEFASEPQQQCTMSELQEKEYNRHQELNVNSEIQGFRMQVSNAKDVEDIFIDPASKNCLNRPCHCGQDSDEHRKIYIEAIEHKEEGITATSSAESLAQISEKTVVYLDDIEFQSPTKRDRDCKSSNKKLRKRSVSVESQRVNDIECLIYYAEPRKISMMHKHKSENPRKNEKKGLAQESEIHNCSLEQPCYCGTKDDNNFHLRRKSSDIVYEFFKYQNPHQPAKKNVRMPPYFRAMTMPSKGSKREVVDNISRSNSLPSRYPNYLHPKMPDYDDLAAKFMALKKDHIQNKRGCDKKYP